MAKEKIVIFHHDERGMVRTWSEVGEIVRCRDCKHRPIQGDGNIVYAPDDIDGWDDETCPCLCEDCYYNWMPEDDFFCKRGERREDDKR